MRNCKTLVKLQSTVRIKQSFTKNTLKSNSFFKNIYRKLNSDIL